MDHNETNSAKMEVERIRHKIMDHLLLSTSQFAATKHSNRQKAFQPSEPFFGLLFSDETLNGPLEPNGSESSNVNA